MQDKIQNKGRSLQQALLGFVGVLLISLLVGSFMLNITVTREYLQNQLNSQAQDAATSLGLSLSSSIDARDEVSAGRMIDAIFDSGDYRRIVFFDTNGAPLVLRNQSLLIQDVPRWFVSSISLISSAKSAQVVSGWTQLGTIVVERHPGYAYVELWEIIKTQLAWFGLIGLVSMLVARVLLTSILKPLKDLEDQATKMSERRFNSQVAIPNFRELAGVASAMNGMAKKLGQMFGEQLELIEDLRSQSFLDDLTSLNNREGFDARLTTSLDSQEKVFQGSLVLFQVNDFSRVNNSMGREFGDELLKSIGGVLSTMVIRFPGAFSARRNGADFSLFLPNVLSDDIDELAKELMSDLVSLPKVKQLLRDDSIHMGIACVRETDTESALFSKADMAMSQAQSKGASGWQRYANIDASLESLGEVRQANEWRAILQNVLVDRSVILYTQAVYGFDKEILYQHVLSRIELEGSILVAGLFLPMAERYNLMVPFDQLVVEKVIGTLASQEASEEQKPARFCISLSEESISDIAFVAWLTQILSENSAVVSQLMFEVSEHIIGFNEQALVNFSLLAQDLGFMLSVERFGVSSVPFSYLQHLNIDIIKVDHSFIRDVDENQSNQFFLRSAVQIAHGQSIKVIAVGVESESEWLKLNSLGLDGAMGYYLKRPEASSLF